MMMMMMMNPLHTVYMIFYYCQRLHVIMICDPLTLRTLQLRSPGVAVSVALRNVCCVFLFLFRFGDYYINIMIVIIAPGGTELAV